MYNESPLVGEFAEFPWTEDNLNKQTNKQANKQTQALKNKQTNKQSSFSLKVELS